MIPAAPASGGSPRNPWTRLLAAGDALAAGDLAGARAVIAGLRHHPGLSPGVLALWQDHLAEAIALRGAPPPLNRPCDYLANDQGLWRPPFRRLAAGRAVPKPYPWGMALPGLVGAGNDTRFLHEAAAALETRLAQVPLRIAVVWTPAASQSDAGQSDAGGAAALRALQADLAAQRLAPPAGLTAFGLSEGPEGTEVVAAPLLSGLGAAVLARITAEADLVLFLSGHVRLDPLALARAARFARLSDRVVQPLAQGVADGMGSLLTPFTVAPLQQVFANRYPFRDLCGLNLALPARLLAEIGAPDIRFADPALAARELAYRAFVRGAWFVPLSVPHLEGAAQPSAAAESELYKALCPNHWDRKREAWHEVPKVSVYIPAYNAAKYIERAVESVLSQDYADLDVCIANDGSRDGTLALLERLYSGEKRVRWIDNPNGGIGFASNSAIRMSRSIYIGQLDSDDCLKPGAVRRLASFLDENAGVACAYASCERIDAAGSYTHDEYSWPVFSREKMMITSIAHHFRMFRRQAWERTTRFREDIVNGVDYDIFLKMSEVGEFRHIDEKYYQRRWHGENTSHVNEHHQTANTHRVQREALARQGLARYWDVHVPDPEKPRNVTYRRPDGMPMVVFWPDYSQGNPYQRLLYARAAERAEVVSGDLAACLQLVKSGSVQAKDVVFHLHWLNALFRGLRTADEARRAADDFAADLVRLRLSGARLVWTIHNAISHDTPFPQIEADLSARIAALADVIHLHSAGSLDEVATAFALPAEKVRVSRHGHYLGAYPDFVDRAGARAALGIGEDEDVILFTGLVRPYKGVEGLVAAFRRILRDRPQARLVIAGHPWFDPLEGLGLTGAERARILVTGRFVEDGELQLFFRAADLAAYPYQKILTSGSLMLALSYGVPVVIPRVAMTAEVLEGSGAGRLYDAAEGEAGGGAGGEAGGEAGLEAALRALLADKDAGRLAARARAARARAEALDWPDFGEILA